MGRLFLRGAGRALSAYSLRSRTVVCREGLYYVVLMVFVFAGALLGDVNLLMILAGMLLGPLWLSWRLVARTLRGLEVVRQVPRGVCAGDPLSVKIELRNTRRRLGSWAIVVEEGIRRDGPARGGESDALRPAVLFSYVPAGETRERSYRGRLTRRGLYRFEIPAVSTRFPFGLLRRTVRVGDPAVLIVHPRLGRLTREWRKRQHEWFEGTHRREVRHGRVSGDFYGVRPWRSGDSRRSIHWRSSARRGTLVVRQFEQHRNRDLAVLVDLWQPDHPGAEDLETVELAVSFAATLVAEACRRGGGDLWVGTSATGSEDVSGPASPLVMHEAMDHLAVAEAASADRLPELIDRALAAVAPGTEIVLVATRAVDLSDAGRFPALAADPVRRAAAQSIRVVNVADPQLDDYFQPEE